MRVGSRFKLWSNLFSWKRCAEEERTPQGPQLHLAERVPEAGPTLSTAPVQPGLGEQVAQFARDLGLDPGYVALAPRLPPEASSSAEAAQSSPHGGAFAQMSVPTVLALKTTAEHLRARLHDMKTKAVKKPSGRRKLCRLLAQRAVDRTIEVLGQSEATEESRHNRRGRKHQRTRSRSRVGLYCSLRKHSEIQHCNSRVCSKKLVKRIHGKAECGKQRTPSPPPPPHVGKNGGLRPVSGRRCAKIEAPDVAHGRIWHELELPEELWRRRQWQ